MIHATLDNQKDLPRYFAAAFDRATRIQNGTLVISLPDGRHFAVRGINPSPQAVINVKNNDLFARILRDGHIGFAEAYIDGWWDTPELQVLMDVLNAGNDAMFEAFRGAGLVRAYEKVRFWLQSNSRRQARKNISFHYDLGNEFYQLWLDETMTYSSALFDGRDMPLADAQQAKYAALFDQLGVEAGDHVLEIGCGWGGFAEYAAKKGVHVTGLTLSHEQLKFAQDRLDRQGLGHMVTFKLQDYRDETGVYDGIASIEMFEAVGEKYWPIYFETVKKCLKVGKRACLQVITIADERFETYRKNVDFIQKYIFPGGMLPSPTALRAQAISANLSVEGSIEFGQCYSKTLRIWHEKFNETWDHSEQLGFDNRFKRIWNFYLTSCAASFFNGNCDVTQVTVKRTS